MSDRKLSVNCRTRGSSRDTSRPSHKWSVTRRRQPREDRWSAFPAGESPVKTMRENGGMSHSGNLRGVTVAGPGRRERRLD